MDASEIPDPSNAIRVAKLLGVDPREMVDALTTKTIFAQGDSVVSPLLNLDHLIDGFNSMQLQMIARCRDYPKFKRSMCATHSLKEFTADYLFG